MSKFLYPIYKLKTKSYIKWWLYHKKAGGSGILSEILEGFSFNLENTLNRKFNLFEIEGNSTQDGTPSPDNEQPIKSAGENGSINEKIGNKNLLVEDINYVSTYHDSKTYLDLYIILGTATNLQAKFIYQSRIDNKGRINATFTAQDDYTRFIIKHNGSTTDLSKIYNFSFKKDVEYTLSLNLTGINPTVDGGFSYNEVMIVEGTSTDYVPHEEQDYSIYTQQPMRSIGDVRDCFVKKDGTWYERHYILRTILNGTENWHKNADSPDGNYISFYLFNYWSALKKALCNKFIWERWDIVNSKNGNYIWSAGGSCGFRIHKDFLNGYNASMSENEKINLFKTYLAEQYANGTPVYVDYILAEPQDLPCTEEQIEALENLPSTYKDFTIIQSEDETPAYLKIQYYKEG